MKAMKISFLSVVMMLSTTFIFGSRFDDTNFVVMGCETAEKKPEKEPQKRSKGEPRVEVENSKK